jgi:hypothetical protein
MHTTCLQRAPRSRKRRAIHPFPHTPSCRSAWLKKTSWSESASELYRSSDRRLSAKWLPTFADRGCHVVSVTDFYLRILQARGWVSTDRSVATALPSTTPRPVPKSSADNSESRHRANVPLGARRRLARCEVLPSSRRAPLGKRGPSSAWLATGKFKDISDVKKENVIISKNLWNGRKSYECRPTCY